jgi:MazG family protein
MIKPPEKLRSFEALYEVVKGLRNPNGGCPWDLEQTHESLTPFMIEEAHELVEAIESGSQTHTIEELGDVLLQVILHSVIAEQDGSYNLMDVIEALNKKLVYRHPHVFGDVEAGTVTTVLENWEKLKAKEKEGKPKADKFEIPVGLPALQRSQKIGAKTKKFKFDWEDISDVRLKVQEELAEVDEALKTQNKDLIQEELGDLLFTVAQLTRHADLDAEGALRQANVKFETRFFKMKRLAESRGLKLENCSGQELEALWQEIKGSI